MSAGGKGKRLRPGGANRKGRALARLGREGEMSAGEIGISYALPQMLP
jgi:hypothetical protein